MARFLQKDDYGMQIKAEVIRLLTQGQPGGGADFFTSPKLVRAENTAISQIRNRIGRRYDCSQVFAPQEPGELDRRDQFIVTITIDIALYHLYSQTGAKDIPQHRNDRYQDAIDWLKDVGNGETLADLPMIVDDDGEGYSEVRINSRPPENQKW